MKFHYCGLKQTVLVKEKKLESLRGKEEEKLWDYLQNQSEQCF